MIFDIDADLIFESINSTLETIGEGLTEEMIGKVLNRIESSMPGITGFLLEDIYGEWRQKALDAKGWGSKYINALKVKIENDGGSIYLDKDVMDKSSNRPFFMFAMMMEHGIKTWSIKDALLSSKKAHTGKDGVKYITVPFPVRTPGKEGNMSSKFGGRRMTKDMHEIVKSGGTIGEGTTITVKNTLRSFEVDISGLSRYNTRQFHSQYGIFRRVSENSKGWQYPNKSATPIYPSVVDYVHRRIQEVLTDFCQEIIKEFS
jgi:hypothetical protein